MEPLGAIDSVGRRPSLDVVIVNWNAGGLLSRCVASVPAALGRRVRLARLTIVDNNSSDDSISTALAANPNVRIMKNVANRGFAAGCNQGAEGGESEYILFLNPDTRLFDGSLSEVVTFMEDNARVGICGIQLVDDTGAVTRSCSRFPTMSSFLVRSVGLDKLFPSVFKAPTMREWAHDSVRAVDQVMGAFFLVRGSLWRQVGGFDERFFVYYEDVDFSLRARYAGFTTIYLSTVQGYHRGGGTSEQIMGRRLYYSLRSRIFYVRKHFSHVQATLLVLVFLMVEPITRLLWAAVRLRPSELGATVRAYQLLAFDLLSARARSA